MPKITAKRNKAGVLIYQLTEQPKTKSKKELPESIDFYQTFKTKHPNLVGRLIHIPNEVKGTARHQLNLNEAGRIKGAPDYILRLPAHGFNSLEIELKRARKIDSSISKEQVKQLLDSERLGSIACVAYGKESALKIIDNYLDGTIISVVNHLKTKKDIIL